MPRFPKLLTTGDPVSITAQPVLRKPLDVTNLLRTMGKSSGGRKSSSTKKTKEDKIEGRIGGVNQIYDDYNYYQGEMKAMLDVLGPAAVFSPEYSQMVYGAQKAMSPERVNTLERQTKYQDKYAADTKDKGTYFHLGQFMANPTLDNLRTHAEWINYTERVRSKELGGSGNEVFETFQWNPTDVNLDDVKTSLDLRYKETGATSSKTMGNAIFQEMEIGSAVGIKKRQTSYMTKSNFGNIKGAYFDPEVQYKDDKGNVRRGGYVNANGNIIRDDSGKVVNDLQQLENAYMNVAMTALRGTIDLTDPIQNGLFQSFLQNRGGRAAIQRAQEAAHEHNKQVDLENAKITDPAKKKEHATPYQFLMQAFRDYTGEYLDNDYKQRRIRETETTNSENFNQYNESNMKRYEKKQLAQTLAESAKINLQSIKMETGIGMPISAAPDSIEGKKFLDWLAENPGKLPSQWALDDKTGYKSVTDGKISAKDFESMFWSRNGPFKVNQKDGVNYIMPSENYSKEAFDAVIQQKIVDGNMNEAEASQFKRDAYSYLGNLTKTYGRVNSQAANNISTSSQLTFDINTPAMQDMLKLWGWDGYEGTEINRYQNSDIRFGNSSYSTSGFGNGIKILKVGTGNMTFERGIIPSNQHFFWVDEKSGQIQSIAANSSEFSTLDPNLKQQLLQGSAGMLVDPAKMMEWKKNPGKYQTLQELKSDMAVDYIETTPEDGSKQIKYQDDDLVQYNNALASSPNATLSMMHLGGSYRVPAQFEITDRAAFVDQTIAQTVPYDYAYDKEYKRIYGRTWYGYGGQKAANILETGDKSDASIKYMQSVVPGTSRQEAEVLIDKIYSYSKNNPDLVQRSWNPDVSGVSNRGISTSSGRTGYAKVPSKAGAHLFTNVIRGKTTQLNLDQSQMITKEIPITKNNAGKEFDPFAIEAMNIRTEKVLRTNAKGQTEYVDVEVFESDMNVTSSILENDVTTGYTFHKYNRENLHTSNKTAPTQQKAAPKLNPR